MVRPLSVLFGVLVAGTCLATSRRNFSVRDYAQRSTQVVIAQVLSQRVETDGAVPPDLQTFSRVGVREYLKGTGPQTLELVEAGGQSGEWSSGVAGDVQLVPGETVLLFLRCDPETAHPRCVEILPPGSKHLVLHQDGRLMVEVSNALSFEPEVWPLENLVDQIRGLPPRGRREAPGGAVTGTNTRGVVHRPVVPIPVGRAVPRGEVR